jgi:hypothetical protein
VESSVNELIAEIDAHEANQWDVIAILRDDNSFPDRSRFSKRDGMDIRLAIPYKEFSGASPQMQQELILDMLLRSLEIIQKKLQAIHAIARAKTLTLRLKNGA